MYCGLEHIELTVSICPVRCCYRGNNGQCKFQELTDDDLEPKTIAVIRHEKVYKVKRATAQAIRSIKIGLAVDRYADFIKSSHRRKTRKVVETVNGIDSHVSKVLAAVFGLAPNQQKKFWSPKRFGKWAQRTGSAITLSDVKESLNTIKL